MDKVKQLVERRQIENTPFTAIKNENDWFLTCGKYRMSTKRFDSYEETTEWIEQNQWELMATFTSIVAEETVKEILNNQKVN